MHFYIIKLQFLGFRFSGWAKNRDVKTLHQMLDKTLEFIFGDQWFKTLGCSRTDAMVSANCYMVQLMTNDLVQSGLFIKQLNLNLPPDIRALSILDAPQNFNIIKSVKEKEYVYLFSCGKKFHPFAASLMAQFSDDLDITLMQQGAKLFEGEHDFINYCTDPASGIKSVRNIICSEIVRNLEYTASFFPEKSYLYRVRARGFMRNQVRLMFGQLVELGRGRITLDNIAESLRERNKLPFRAIAPASGLILNEVYM